MPWRYVCIHVCNQVPYNYADYRVGCIVLGQKDSVHTDNGGTSPSGMARILARVCSHIFLAFEVDFDAV